MNPPAVRFVRMYDVQNHRMINAWLSLQTQDQIDNAPRAVECEVTAKTYEEAVELIKTFKLPEETLREILACPADFIPALSSVYYSEG